MEVMLVGNYGHTNLGDEAIMRGVARLFDDIKVETIIVTDDKDNSRVIHGSNFNFISFRDGICGFWPLDYLREMYRIAKGVQKVDAVAIGGGGLFNDIHPKAFIKYVYYILISVIFSKKVFILGVSVGPLESFFLKKILRYALAKCEFVVFRDFPSREFFCRGYVAPDMALYPFQNKTDLISQSGGSANNLLLVSLVGVRAIKEDSFESHIVDIINEHYISKISCIKIIVMDFDRDLASAEIFKSILVENFPRVEVDVTVSTSISELYEVFQSCRYVIGERLHACILAECFGKEYTVLSYQEKVKNYFFSHGLACQLYKADSDNLPFIFRSEERIGFPEVVGLIKASIGD